MKNDYAFDLAKHPILKQKRSPFLRWAGGKKALLNNLISILPKRATHYYEPFIGGGALYFAISPNRATISDFNTELINCYQHVASHPEEIINSLSKSDFNKNCYYDIRKKIPESDLEKTKRFIYLNRTCWNGLYRVNKKGEFNVPIGKFSNGPILCPEKDIRKASEILKHSEIISDDFEKIVENSNKSDFIYFDPPYTVKHDNNGFLKYNEKVFSWKDQERLSELSLDLKKRGVNIMISNAAHDDIIDLYEDFYKFKVSRSSVISGRNSARGRVNELIITSYKITKNNGIQGIEEVH